jgi:hypothetical protein
VSFADSVDFGPYHVLSPGTKRVQARLSDEALYALALYIYSLEPPPNPNPRNDKAIAGERIFIRERCGRCHTPPLYTNNKLTLAEGFTPPRDAPPTLDILRVSVGTDPGLALATRKGTGYYKVPSLKGVWYRGHYLHDGSAGSLEEMFDPDRLQPSHVPGIGKQGRKPFRGRTLRGNLEDIFRTFRLDRSWRWLLRVIPSSFAAASAARSRRAARAVNADSSVQPTGSTSRQHIH